MKQTIVLMVGVMVMVASPALGERIDPNDDTFLFGGGASNTNFDDARLSIRNPTKALILLEFDIPAGTAAGDIFLHIWGGPDPDTTFNGTQTIGTKAGLYDFDETLETWNTAGWLGGAVTTPVDGNIIISAGEAWQWRTIPLADVINAGLHGQATPVTFWLNGDLPGSGDQKWSVFEDREGSAFDRHGTDYVPGAGYGPWIYIVPEPSSVTLLALGALPLLLAHGALRLLRRRRRG